MRVGPTQTVVVWPAPWKWRMVRPPGEGIVDGEAGSVPALAAEVGVVGVAGVEAVEGMRQGGLLPQVVFFGAPDLPDAVEGAFAELPAGVEPEGGGGWSGLVVFGSTGFEGGGTETRG